MNGERWTHGIPPGIPLMRNLRLTDRASGSSYVFEMSLNSHEPRNLDDMIWLLV
jgi:hypothetical protein